MKGRAASRSTRSRRERPWPHNCHGQAAIYSAQCWSSSSYATAWPAVSHRPLPPGEHRPFRASREGRAFGTEERTLNNGNAITCRFRRNRSLRFRFDCSPSSRDASLPGSCADEAAPRHAVQWNRGHHFDPRSNANMRRSLRSTTERTVSPAGAASMRQELLTEAIAPWVTIPRWEGPRRQAM
jgi:hypothetical protein